MYRFLFAPKWIAFHALVLVAVIGMVSLGMWQFRRLDERQEFNATVEARYDATPIPIGELLDGDTNPDDVEWRPVTAVGTYEPDGQILIVNRSQNGRAGDNVVVPMRLDDGRVLLVNRGFVPLGLDIPDAPNGRVDVAGRLRPSQERRFAQLSDPEDGDLAEAQRVDIERLTPQIEGEVIPMYIDLFGSDPAETSPFPEPVATPDLGEGSHLSYAIQWFIFAIAVIVGWVLAVNRSIKTRQRPTPAKTTT